MYSPLAEQRGEGSLFDASNVRVARILVIEDNLSDVFLLKRALSKLDFHFELTHLACGSEALEFIRGQGAYLASPVPDLILVDLNLYKYTGADILREIRGAVRFRGVPVCVWSSSRSARDEAQLRDLGIARFIPKPAGLDQFMEIGTTLRNLITLPTPGATR